MGNSSGDRSFGADAVVIGGTEAPRCISASSVESELGGHAEVRALADAIIVGGVNQNEPADGSGGSPITVYKRSEMRGISADAGKTETRENSGGTDEPSEKPRDIRRIAALAATAAAIVLTLAVTGFVIYETYKMTSIVNSVNYVHGSLNFDKVDVLVSDSETAQFVSHTDESKNILLCGCDIDQNGISRTDSMIILTIDHAHKKIKMTSLMRDMYLQIPRHGKNKLNASYTFGGGNLLLNTIYANFGMKIDRYVCVNYDVFASVVDNLGGVEVEIEEMELEQFNKYVRGGKKNRISAAGRYLFNGQQALSYCRIRKVGSDTARTARQRKVLDEIMKKCRRLSPVQAQNILSVAAPHITTNMTREELTSLLLEGISSRDYGTMGLRIPMDGAWTDKKKNGVWYVEVNINQIARSMNRFIYGDDDTAQALVDSQKKLDERRTETDRAKYEKKNKKKK